MVDFQKSQQALADYLRYDDGQELPDAQGWDIYRQLVTENFRALIEKTFPVAWNLLPASRWQDFIVHFLKSVRPKTPYFHELGKVFLDFIERRSDLWAEDYPFLLELMHFEWIELALAIAPEEIPAAYGADLSMLDAVIEVSPLAWPLVYQYPVHRMADSGLVTTISEIPLCLIGYRKRNDNVSFMEVSTVMYAVIELLQSQKNMTAREAFEIIAQGFAPAELHRLSEQGAALLQHFLEEDIIVGLKRR